MTKLIKIAIGAAAVLLIALSGFCTWFLSGSGSTEYYTRIDNSRLSQADPEGGVISLNGRLPYAYTLPCYDANGGGQTLTFGVSRALREGAFLRLTVVPVRGVLGWDEVAFDALPAAVQARCAPPSGGEG